MYNETSKASRKIINNYSSSNKLEIISQYTNHLTSQAEETIRLQTEKNNTKHEQSH